MAKTPPRKPRVLRGARKETRKQPPPPAAPFTKNAVFDNAPIPMHEIDRDGILRRVNRAECELLGFEPEELIGRDVSEFVAPAEREASRDAVRRKLAEELPLAPFRRTFVRRDGENLTLEIHEDLIRDGAGRITGLRSALMDVSEQQRVQDDLRQAHEELDVRVRARTLELARVNDALRREIAERRRAEQRLSVQYAVSRVLAESPTVEIAVPRLLEAIGARLDWHLGAWWSVDRERGALRLIGCWPQAAHEAPGLAGTSYAPGQAIPGRVWESGSPEWVDGPLESALGWPIPPDGSPWRTALFFPVMSGGNALGVVAFFSRFPHPRDEELLRTAGHLGVLMGQFLERRDAEAERDRSEARFTAFMDHLPAVAYIKDTSGRYVYFSPAAEALVGIDPRSILGHADREIWPPELAATFAAQDRQVLETGKPLEATVAIPGAEGAPRQWLFYRFPVPESSGLPLYVGAIAVDVTERRLLEEQLRQSQKMDAIGRLAGGVAHDFNNLLTIIGGYGRMILDQLPPGDRARGSMELILNAADRAAVLTSQLLAFSRRQVVQPRLLELNHVVSNLEKMLRRVIGEHIELRTHLDSRLNRIKADSGQIEQILMNLAINARDAMPDGGTLTIETANAGFRRPEALEAPPTPHVRLSVIDSGVGMDPHTKSRIFEPFFTTKGRGKGTGLGLSTVYGIVKQHGGDIVVASQPGAGTSFHIYFPAAPGEGVDEAAEAAPEAASSGSETILLVEDEVGVRRLTRDILRSRGYRVLEAADGHEALRIAEREGGAIQLLLTDMIMPLMGGRELANRIQELYPGVRVVFMSGYTDDVIAYHGDLGSDTTLVQKPFAPDVIARKVREVLDAGKEGALRAGPQGRS